MEGAYDVVVIGSGFGGAITGCRLAQSGHSVCILERGKRWKKSEFPRSVADMRSLFWSGDNPLGLIDYGNFKGIDVIRASGVGGGSLVYFNVHLETPVGIFNKNWPAGLNRAALEPYYDRVREIIEAKPLTPPDGMGMLPRTKAFFDAASKAGSRPKLVNIAVYTGPDRKNPYGGVDQSGCVYCSNDLLGCHVHAKNTLDLNYIPLAEKAGAEVFPLHFVDRIEPLPDGRYKVCYQDIREKLKGEVAGRKVIVAAGTLGTNELLLKCRDIHGTLPHLSNMLGRGFSGNGDFLLEATWNTPSTVDPTRGPSITAVADFSTKDNHIHIEDLGFPDALAWYVEGAVPPFSRFVRALKFAAGYLSQSLNMAGDNRLASHIDIIGRARTLNFLPYLGMGTDAANGVMGLKGGQIDIDWNSDKSKPMFGQMEKAFERLSAGLGGKYITSPLWLWPAKKLLTAHPLGGCRMSDNIDGGVVNQYGEVWGYPDLYVADGSIVPTALSVNPSMTIAALSERIAEHIVEKT